MHNFDFTFIFYRTVWSGNICMWSYSHMHLSICDQ